MLDWIDAELRPAVSACGAAEIAGVLTALDGRHVEPGRPRARASRRPHGRDGDADESDQAEEHEDGVVVGAEGEELAEVGEAPVRVPGAMGAEQGTLTVMASGPKEAFERVTDHHALRPPESATEGAA